MEHRRRNARPQVPCRYQQGEPTCLTSSFLSTGSEAANSSSVTVARQMARGPPVHAGGPCAFTSVVRQVAHDGAVGDNLGRAGIDD